MKLNNKGFTLIEVLGAVVILTMVMAFMIPAVNTLFLKNQEAAYKSIKNNIILAAKNYFSDYRYDVVINGTCSSDDKRDGALKDVLSINANNLSNNKVIVKTLVDRKYLELIDNKIEDPREKGKVLNFDSSYVIVKFNCKTKNYNFTVEDSYLKWN